MFIAPYQFKWNSVQPRHVSQIVVFLLVYLTCNESWRIQAFRNHPFFSDVLIGSGSMAEIWGRCKIAAVSILHLIVYFN